MNNKKVSIIAGGAGFIGVNLIFRLLSEGRKVFIIDNMSRGSLKMIKTLNPIFDEGQFVISCDCSNSQALSKAFQYIASHGEICEVWHLAANSDIPAGVSDASVDLTDTFMTTLVLLEQMKEHRVPNIHFASSSAIYGDLGPQVLHENIGPLLPISNYGAMKLASEALISASVESYLNIANIFRFPNVVGVPATHGVILDFISKLIATPNELVVLGDGTQQKSYLHVSDLVDAMLIIRGRSNFDRVELVNIGPIDDGISVRSIAEAVIQRVSPKAKITYGVGNKGWVGDVPKFRYSTDKLQSFGWIPKLNSSQAVHKAIDEIATQLGV